MLTLLAKIALKITKRSKHYLVELTDEDVGKLFSEGYQTVDCDQCKKPVGVIRVYFGYDYRTDETLCFDCAYAKVQKWKYEEGKIYG